MKAHQGLSTFLRQHKNAWPLADKASEDYLLARFGLLNNLWSSFEIAAQAVEKLLKAYLLFKDANLGGDPVKMRRIIAQKARLLGRTDLFGHDIEACHALAQSAGFPGCMFLPRRLMRINKYYFERYPDSSQLGSMSTKELDDIDEAIFEIWDAFKGINEDYYYACGIMLPVYSWISHQRAGHDNSPTKHYFSIMCTKNGAFAHRHMDLIKGVNDRLDEWHPRK